MNGRQKAAIYRGLQHSHRRDVEDQNATLVLIGKPPVVYAPLSRSRLKKALRLVVKLGDAKVREARAKRPAAKRVDTKARNARKRERVAARGYALWGGLVHLVYEAVAS